MLFIFDGVTLNTKDIRRMRIVEFVNVRLYITMKGACFGNGRIYNERFDSLWAAERRRDEIINLTRYD